MAADDGRHDLSRELEETNFLLNQKVVQLETLYEAGLSLAASLRAEEVVGPFLQQVVAVVDARGGFLLLKGESSQHVALAEHLNLSPAQIQALTGDVGLRSRLRRARAGGAAVQLRRQDLPPGFDADYVVAAPMAQIGYLGVVDKESRTGVGAFDESDVHLLQLLCQQAGTSLSNARLYRRMEAERNLNLSIFNSVANGVISTDLQGLVARANPAAKRIIGGRPLFGRTCAGIFEKLGCRQIAATIEACLASGADDEVRNEKTAAGDLTLNARIGPLRDAAGRMQGLVVAIENRTEQTRVRDMFRRFASDQVVDMLLAGDLQEALGGTRQTATVLFTDVVGSTELLHRIGAEQMVRLMNDCYTRLVEVVLANDGTLDKYTGDGFMAVFGAPIPRDDDSRRAVQAALDLQAEMARFCSDSGQRLGLGIGISRGTVVAGNIGSPRRMEYSVIGPEVAMASRLVDRARAGEVLVSSAVYFDQRDHFAFAAAGRHSFKHFRDPIEIFRVLGPPGAPDPFHDEQREAAAGEEQRVELDVPMIPNMEVTVSEAAEAFASLMGLSLEKTEEMKAALIEGCINAFEHSQSKDRRLQVEFRSDSRAFTVQINDRGHGFDVHSALERSRARRARGESRRGWGLELMERFVDQLEVESDAQGTTLTLIKYR